jgi:G:T-mismatch repair DNA endonuclease (very short patch repair protein)
MDTLSPKERSERMGRVKGKDTKPELVVRSLVHRLGFRWMPKSRRDFWEPKQEEPKT